jgi:hypothetical protein
MCVRLTPLLSCSSSSHRICTISQNDRLRSMRHVKESVWVEGRRMIGGVRRRLKPVTHALSPYSTRYLSTPLPLLSHLFMCACVLGLLGWKCSSLDDDRCPCGLYAYMRARACVCVYISVERCWCEQCITLLFLQRPLFVTRVYKLVQFGLRWITQLLRLTHALDRSIGTNRWRQSGPK